jgi:cytochrome c biogenesis protein CcmG/thiol:disulfide interchange protein DsbE
MKRLIPFLGSLLLTPLLLSTSVPAEEVAVGTVPPLSARNIDGEKFVLSEALLEGPVVVTFWATWCKPCRKELPELQKLVDKYGDRGFQVVAISGDGPVDEAKVRPYVKSQKFTFEVIGDQDGEIRRRFQVEVFPTTFLVGDEGAILHRAVGYRRGDEKLLDERLAKLLAVPPAGESPEESPDTPSPDSEGR